jgi:hypothetical protein
VSDCDAINRLRRIAARLIERGDEDGAWFATCLAEYQAAARFKLDLGVAFGLRPGAGRTGWWERESCAARDQCIRRIGAGFYGEKSKRGAASALMKALGRYKATGWRRDKEFRYPPPAIAGTLDAELHRLLKLGVPVSISTARAALDSAKEPGVYVSHPRRQHAGSRGE